MNFCPKCGANVQGMNFCHSCGMKITNMEEFATDTEEVKSEKQYQCQRCGAELANGKCAYCGYSTEEYVEEKDIILQAFLSECQVTSKTITITTKLGKKSVLNVDELSHIRGRQAGLTSQGELAFKTYSGIVKSVKFSSSQNTVYEEIMSYLWNIAPNADFGPNARSKNHGQKGASAPSEEKAKESTTVTVDYPVCTTCGSDDLQITKVQVGRTTLLNCICNRCRRRCQYKVK